MITLDSVTRGFVVRPPRMILLGVEKIGKSSFAAGADNPIFIPIKLEEGIDALNVSKFPVCHTFEEVEDCLRVLATENHKFKTVVIDSGTALEPLIWQDVCTEYNVNSIEKAGGGYGKGYTFALERWHRLQNALDYLRDEKNMASIIIGHVKVKRFDDPERASYDQYQFDINDKISASLYRWADFIGFANLNIDITAEEQGFKKTKIKAIDLDVGSRFLFTTKTPAHPGGGRGVYGQLLPYIPLDWESFQAAVADAVAEEKKKQKVKRS